MLGLGVGLARQSLLSRIIDENLVPVLDFTQWQQSGAYGMSEVTENSFTNQATAGIALDIGAEAGKSYRLELDMSRGEGALRVYLSEDGTIATNNDVHDLSSGASVTTIVATGPYLTFRASVGNTTTIVNSLRIVEIGGNA